MNYNEIIANGIPKHIAIILDGNGRWAKSKGLPRTLGHRKGGFNLRDIATEANKMGVECLTVYCFSTENWKRPTDEVNYLMTQPIKYFKKYKKQIAASSIRIKVIGRKDRFSPEFLGVVNELEEITKDHNKLTLVLAVDYGSQNEMIMATKQIAQDVLDGKTKIEDINEELFEKNLFTKDFPKLDLLIRTSGEVRISNFLLWQLAYSELYFTDVYWPDFDKYELYKAIDNFQKRNRRFGGLKEERK